MHELGIVFYVINLVEDVAKENELTKVTRVKLTLGEVSGVIPHYLTDCWQWAAAKNELLYGSILEIEEMPARTICNSCGKAYETVRYAKICPHCGSDDTELLQGNEVELKEIEAE